MKYIYRAGGVLILILAPIVVNFLMCTPPLDKFSDKTCFDSSGWLSFWGAYLGGIFTAAIAWFINNRSIADTHKQLLFTKQNEGIDNLTCLLADIQTSLSLTSLLDLALIGKQVLSYKRELVMKINANIMQIESIHYSFLLKYDDSKEDYIIKYKEQYKKCIHYYYDIANKVTKLLSYTNDANTYLDEFIKLSEETKDTNLYKELFKFGKDWIAKESKSNKELLEN